MAEESNKKQKKKGSISQEDIYSVIQRYSVTTVLTLLKEIAQVADLKIDWNELVKKTATGITNAREYQMLWRHLAYRDTIKGISEEATVPMDDDSDLDFELEAHPPVGSEGLREAAACAKVVLASGSLSNNNLASTVEAPLVVNIPSGQSSSDAFGNPQLQETNIIIPVLVQKQPMPTDKSGEGCDPNGLVGGSLPSNKKKRNKWSKEEDDELIAAVHRCGEGNWANILKREFKSDRSASQLSQRWTILRRRTENLSIGGPQAAEVQAVRRAVQLAVDMPLVNTLSSGYLNGKGGTNTNSTTNPSYSTRPTAGESSQQGTQSQNHHRQDSDPLNSSRSRFMTSTKSSTSPALSPDDMVKAAAVAAGARIATPSDAASLLKAAQSKNAVHIMPGGSSSIKSSGPSNVNSLPPNVHYIRTGLVNRSTSGHNTASSNALKQCGTSQAQNHISRPSPPGGQINLTQTTKESNQPKEKTRDGVVSVSGNDQMEQVQKSAASFPGNIQMNSAQSTSVTYLLKEKVLDRVPAVSRNVPLRQVRISVANVQGNVRSNLIQNNNRSNIPESKARDEASVIHENAIPSVSGNEAKQNIHDQASVLHDDARERAQNALPGSEIQVEDEKNDAEDSRCLSTSKVDGKTGLSSNKVESGSEREEENKMIETPVEKHRQTDSTSRKAGNGSEKGDENFKLIEIPVQEDGEKKSTPEKVLANPSTDGKLENEETVKA